MINVCFVIVLAYYFAEAQSHSERWRANIVRTTDDVAEINYFYLIRPFRINPQSPPSPRRRLTLNFAL